MERRSWNSYRTLCNYKVKEKVYSEMKIELFGKNPTPKINQFFFYTFILWSSNLGLAKF